MRIYTLYVGTDSNEIKLESSKKHELEKFKEDFEDSFCIFGPNDTKLLVCKDYTFVVSKINYLRGPW